MDCGRESGMTRTVKVKEKTERPKSQNRPVESRKELGLRWRNDLFNMVRKVEREYDLPPCKITT